MTLTRFNDAWTADRKTVRWTEAGVEGGLSNAGSGRTDPEDRRREIVDLLLGWRRDPSALRADELQPPTTEVIDAALRIVQGWRRSGIAPPDRVVPNDEGGLAFEWYPDPWFIDLELFPDGSAERRITKDARLVDHERMRWKEPEA